MNGYVIYDGRIYGAVLKVDEDGNAVPSKCASDWGIGKLFDKWSWSVTPDVAQWRAEVQLEAAVARCTRMKRDAPAEDAKLWGEELAMYQERLTETRANGAEMWRLK